MQKKHYNLTVTHVFADGSAVTDETFFLKPYEVKAESNFDFLYKANKVLDPDYYRKEHLRNKLQRAEERKARLLAEKIELMKELNEIREQL